MHPQRRPCCRALMVVRLISWQNEYSQFCAPLTSFDWSDTSPNLIATSSIDTTCSVWDINVRWLAWAVALRYVCAFQTGQETGRTKGEIKTQLIAHDQEVYDVSFSKGRAGSANNFATVGADGSVRLFDLRCVAASQALQVVIAFPQEPGPLHRHIRGPLQHTAAARGME